MFDPTPTELFAGWSEDGTDITLPIASLPELTAAEADAVTGDSRKISYALAMKIADWFLGLPTADRPSRMTVTRTPATETSPGIFTRTISMQFQTSGGPLDVADEPS